LTVKHFKVLGGSVNGSRGFHLFGGLDAAFVTRVADFIVANNASLVLPQIPDADGA
jgi:hypothetical protein